MTTQLSEKKVRELLSASGLRFTKQRSLIIQILNAQTDHLDADEVYRIARGQFPDISLSTVYRTLGSLKEYGVITEHHFGEDHHHYETDQGNHHHFVCENCRAIIEFKMDFVHTIQQNVTETQGFTITSADVSVRGLCKECSGTGKVE